MQSLWAIFTMIFKLIFKTDLQNMCGILTQEHKTSNLWMRVYYNGLWSDLLVGRGVTLQKEWPIGTAKPCEHVEKNLNSVEKIP